MLTFGKISFRMEESKCCTTSKEGDKQCIKNYYPVSFLPVCGKVFERLLYNNMFSFFSKNDLASPKQPGLNQEILVLSITYEIYSSFDDRHEVRCVFLHISKAFDRV